MELAGKDLDPENEKELIVRVENEQRWVLGIENTGTAGSENTEIIEWNENREIITEKGHEVGKGNIEGPLKKNIMMTGKDLNETNVKG